MKSLAETKANKIRATFYNYYYFFLLFIDFVFFENEKKQDPAIALVL